MKLPWPKKKPASDAAKDIVKPGSKEVAERLHKSGDEGTLVLTTDKLVKKYRQRTVANQVSIEVHQGEIVGLLGPNGAGKTTTHPLCAFLCADYHSRRSVSGSESSNAFFRTARSKPCIL